MFEPLANKIRPTTLKDYVGQEHLVGEGKPLRVAIEQKKMFSFILYGPPGVGKTTIARIYANAMDAEFFELSAVSASKDDIKKIVEQPTMFGKAKILFLDEIHRFNKAQQDYLLPFVENGKLYLIGATTENPSFEVTSPLLSRCQVFVLKSLTEEEIKTIILRIVKDKKIKVEDENVFSMLINISNGDARHIITIIESVLELYGTLSIENIKQSVEKTLMYDKKGEEHYNTISAFIKSMRASKPSAALYYLARMVNAGEDPLFIARRMVIFASEDIGLADNNALALANAVFQACQTIGYPECAINLAHGVAYLARAPKSRRSNDAFADALIDAHKFGNLPIPFNLRNPETKLMKEWGYGKGYKQYDKDSDLLPDKLKGRRYM